MERRHILSLQGQEFVTYEGLLNEAHLRGLKSIRTQIVQIPLPENQQTAIVTAEVEMDGGQIFTGVGDASPQNVSSMIVKHLLRMAETRGKARALRDAVNVGMTAIEELADTTELASKQAGSLEGQLLASLPNKLASPKQINKVAAEMARVGWSDKEGRDYLIKRFNKLSRSELTGPEISQMIDHLISLPTKDAAS